MADDPYVREIGRLEDDQGRIVIVGAGHGAVTLQTLCTRTYGAVALGCAQAEEFGQLLVRACWEAARQGGDRDAD